MFDSLVRSGGGGVLDELKWSMGMGVVKEGIVVV